MPDRSESTTRVDHTARIDLDAPIAVDAPPRTAPVHTPGLRPKRVARAYARLTSLARA